jgi:DNA-directed RNA polymerase omega subunit
MYPIPIEELIPKSGGSVYKLARMAALRAIELSEGKKALISKSYPSEKLTTTALREIAAGRVVAAEVADEQLNREPLELFSENEVELPEPVEEEVPTT